MLVWRRRTDPIRSDVGYRRCFGYWVGAAMAMGHEIGMLTAPLVTQLALCTCSSEWNRYPFLCPTAFWHCPKCTDRWGLSWGGARVCIYEVHWALPGSKGAVTLAHSIAWHDMTNPVA